jgi:phage shock protein A
MKGEPPRWRNLTLSLEGSRPPLAVWVGEAQAAAIEVKADILTEEKADLASEKAALESEKATLESDKADLESDVDSLTSDVSALGSQVSTLEADVGELSAKAGSTMNYAIGAIIGLIIGAVAVFFLKK